jgi:hypothetical protein
MVHPLRLYQINGYLRKGYQASLENWGQMGIENSNRPQVHLSNNIGGYRNYTFLYSKYNR